MCVSIHVEKEGMGEMEEEREGAHISTEKRVIKTG